LPWIKGNFDPALQEQVLCVPMTILILYHDQELFHLLQYPISLFISRWFYKIISNINSPPLMGEHPANFNAKKMSNDLKYGHKINKLILIADIISGVVLLLFLYTSLSKMTEYEVFKNVLTVSPLLKPVAGIVAWLLPVTEIVIVVLLFIPSMRLKGLYASFILISLFTLYLIYMITFTPNLPCNCGGVLKLLTWKQHIFFNLFFIFLSLTGILVYKRGKNRRSNPPP